MASGGAFIVAPTNGHVVFHCPLEPACTRAIVTLARPLGVWVFFDEPDRVAVEADRQRRNAFRADADFEITFVADILGQTTCRPTKISMAGDPSAPARLAGEIRRRHLPTSLSYGQPTYLDVTADGVDKGSGIKRLAHYLGLEPGRIAVIGDGHNDLGMFQMAGLSIAMGNAPPPVQAAAQRIAPTDDEDGVA